MTTRELCIWLCRHEVWMRVDVDIHGDPIVHLHKGSRLASAGGPRFHTALVRAMEKWEAER